MGATTSKGRSRLGGVPTVLPPPADVRQLGLAIDPASRQRHDPLPGVVHVTGWLDADRQRQLVADFRRWAVPPAGLRHPRMPSGHLMSVQSVCLGWHWQPYGYSRTADDTDGAPVKPLPADLAALAQGGGRRHVRTVDAVRARRRHRQPLRARCAARPAPGRRGAGGGAGGDDQPR